MVRSKCKDAAKDDSFEMDKIEDVEEEQPVMQVKIEKIEEKKRPESRRGRPPLSSYEKKDPPAPVRVGGRMKKAKVVFDPADFDVPMRKRQPKSNNSNKSLDSSSDGGGSQSNRNSFDNSTIKIEKNPDKTTTNSYMSTIIVNNKPLEKSKSTIQLPSVSSSSNLKHVSRNSREEVLKEIDYEEDQRKKTLFKKQIEMEIQKQRQNFKEKISTAFPSTKPSLKRKAGKPSRPIDSNYYSLICLICLNPGLDRDLLKCSVMYCDYKAHYKCLKIEGDDFDLALLQNQWQCPHCKTCVVCFENSVAGELTLCTVCDDAYHSVCHTPRVNLNQSLENWKCCHCSSLDPKIISKSNSTGTHLTQSLLKKKEKLKRRLTDVNNATEIKLELDDDDDEVLLEEASILPTPPSSQTFTNVGAKTEIDKMSDDGENTCGTEIKDENMEFAGFSDEESDSTTRMSVPRGVPSTNKEPTSSSNNTEDDIVITKIITDKTPENKADDNHLFGINKKFRFDDVANWSCEQVYEYFVKYFPNHANIFRDQEIDGSSIMLMKRSDVTVGLNLKLGPALRIYRHILMMQTRKCDPTLSWL